MECPVCKGERWVCENHADKPWNKTDDGCECGAGMPCEMCNGHHSRLVAPQWPPGTTVICDFTKDKT
jgi:hypothetical protein